ncbi:hypothetical protein IE53DRAFT_408886 [Violaceomyces palustris]|uniref:Uncharacterized protein n=1 Tax=Violaceomyces palustris TaxID=1673888 RepID=A0ACD0P5F8_9BASI|nr:hypothetical protein IE53DRAFT_408886 [Violaceomyces palustris]
MTKAPSPSSAKTHSSLKPVARTRRPWKGEEDRKLESYVSSFGQKKAINWKGVACHLPGRTAKDCQKRWKHALNKAYSKGTWSIHEDLKLREGYLLFPEQWVKISVHVGTRSNDQCSKRWREVLDPCIHKGNWSLEEDRLLLELFTSLQGIQTGVETPFLLSLSPLE